MKTLLITLATSLTLTITAPAQDFRAFPPAQQPNAAELAYFKGKHPNAPEDARAGANVQLVIDFLNDLANGQMEAAFLPLAEGFRAYGPSFRDSRDADDLLQEADRNQRLFANQKNTISRSEEVVTPEGAVWVYLAGEWSAVDKRDNDEPIRITFYQLTQLFNGKIVTTYVSYGHDRLFYDLGFPIYGQSSETAKK